MLQRRCEGKKKAEPHREIQLQGAGNFTLPASHA
jgi:hypothetical protein